MVSLSALVVAYILLAQTTGAILFYGLCLGFGICWGVAMPLLNGLIFERSAPRFRAINTNLAMVMFQGGFFLGPLLGGWILNDWDYQTLYYLCGGLILVSLFLTPWLKKRKDN
jgi:MFS family permease